MISLLGTKSINQSIRGLSLPQSDTLLQSQTMKQVAMVKMSLEVAMEAKEERSLPTQRVLRVPLLPV
jgi:hypothetical protein